MVRRARAWSSAALLVIGAASSFALVPPDRPSAEFEIAPPAYLPASWDRFVRGEESIDADLGRFAALVGGSWAVQRDPLTGAPHQLVGSGLAYAVGPVDSEKRAIEIAQAFLSEHADLLHLDPERFGDPTATYALGRWAVLFPEAVAGVPVLGGRAHAVITREGRIYAIGSDFHPDLSIATTPGISAGEAAAIAGLDLGYVPGRDGDRETELWIFPARSENGIDYRLAWRVRFEMTEPLGRWETWVDARSGEVFGRKNLHELTDVSGAVTATIDEPNPCVPAHTLPIKEAGMQIVGGGTSTTADDGSFTVTNPGTDSVDLWTRFYGPRFNVDRMDGVPDAQDTVRVLPGVPVAIHWDDATSHVAERDAWRHSNTVRDFIKTLDPAFIAMDYRMRVRVNRSDGYCPGNAWWDGNSMNFCLRGGSYENTATLGDVVYHEYGHGVTQNLYGGFSYDGAISEGNSDVIAMLATRCAMLGPGFGIGACEIGIRTANNSMTYPDDLSGEGHHDGQLIAGFFWEARSNLVTTYGVATADSVVQHLWHFSRKAGHPADMQDQVTWTFLYDDQDGNLDNGTPNFADLELAASRHGFAAPVVSQGVQIAHAGLESTTDTAATRTVSATVEGLSAGVDPSSVKLFYRVSGGAFQEVPMSPAGPPDVYEASLPPASQGDRVEYYVEAADSAAHVNRSPTNAPVALHRYDVAYLYDPCEALGGWTIGDPSDGAIAGIWINAEPVGNDTRPEYDVTGGSGVNCFVTGNTGNVNGGKTTLYSPVYDLSGKTGVVVRYDRWYSNDFDAIGPLVGRDDFWQVDVSNDGGSSWAPVEDTNEGTESWIEVEVAIDSIFPAPGEVQFRFVAEDTGSATRIHAAVDDFRILIESDISTSVADAGGDAPRSFALGENRPNPFNPTTTLSYSIPARDRVSIAVFAPSGRLVRTLVDEVREAGSHQAVWDGTDDSGRPVGSGVYFYRLKSGDRAESRRMTLIR